MSNYVSEPKKMPTVRKRDKSESSVIADEMRIKIPPGEYQAICYDTKYGISFGGRSDLYVKFKIYGGEFDGIKLFMVCTKPTGKIPMRFKLYTQWSLALGRVPWKGQRFSAKVFRNKMYRVLVRDTKRKFSNKRVMPEYLQYSVVAEITETITGVDCE